MGAKPGEIERSDTFYAKGGRDLALVPNPSPEAKRAKPEAKPEAEAEAEAEVEAEAEAAEEGGKYAVNISRSEAGEAGAAPLTSYGVEIVSDQEQEAPPPLERPPPLEGPPPEEVARGASWLFDEGSAESPAAEAAEVRRAEAASFAGKIGTLHTDEAGAAALETVAEAAAEAAPLSAEEAVASAMAAAGWEATAAEVYAEAAAEAVAAVAQAMTAAGWGDEARPSATWVAATVVATFAAEEPKELSVTEGAPTEMVDMA